ncbi:MAG: nucleoside triphosphate pyrophosphohydrolase [Acidobacteriota bacterium]|nr:nucleoside triphosphate pyrophosphohydrolase [Acidobacteriota bacterium]
MSDAPAAAALFSRLIAIMQMLRSPDGCPWDRKQTLESLRRFLLEEAYEVLEAIDGGDDRALAEELGDLLFEVVFLAQIGAEAGRFTIADALQSITDKLVRRHPHVFGDAPRAKTAEEVPGVWEQIKAAERAAAGTPDEAVRPTILSGVPRALPSLLRATALGSRASAVGFDWQQAPDVIAKVEEEVAELREVVTSPAGLDPVRAEEEMGDLLFSLANLARKLGIEPESALRKANDKFTRRFDAMETRFAESGRSLHGAELEDMEEAWRAVKDTEH